MAIEICTIGGYTKIEGNSVAVKVDDEVIVLDMGLCMENYVKYQEDREDLHVMTYDELLKVEAVPDYTHIKDWIPMVKAIIPSHAHLDHVGAIPYAAKLFPGVPIVSTPYTIEVLKRMLWDDKTQINNKFYSVKMNGTFKVSDKISVEFINMTHSIPHTATLCIHTPYGKVLYANDYKFDRQPIVGMKPNFKRLKELGQEGVKCIIMECLYAHEHRKMPSENVAKQMLRDVMMGSNTENKAMFVSTFSSHIARLKSIIDLGKRLNRKIFLVGRSLDKYVRAAEKVGLVNFTKDVKLIRRKDQINRLLRAVETKRDDYMVICTGHQGEPRAVLSRLVNGEFDFQFQKDDIVIFSCSVIPVEVNIQARELLESKLDAKAVRMFKDIHVSGHAAREDHRDMLEMIQPEIIIPAHAGADKAQHIKDLSDQLKIGNTKIMSDGERFTLE